MTFELIIERSGESSRVLRIEGERATLGRKSASDLVLSASDVSKHHATVERRSGGYFLIDQGSRNGTHLGGERVEAFRPIALRDGDVLRIGSFLITLRLDDTSQGADWRSWGDQGERQAPAADLEAADSTRFGVEPSTITAPAAGHAVSVWLERWFAGDRAREAEQRVPIAFEHLAAWFAAALERRAAVQEALSLDYSEALGKHGHERLSDVRTAQGMIRALLDPAGPISRGELDRAVGEASAALSEQRIGEALGLDACLRSALGSLAPDGIRDAVSEKGAENSADSEAVDARCWREYRRRFAILMDENGLIESRLNEQFRDLFLDLQSAKPDPDQV